jgi:GNAT superfamily N-acetyltransferase
MTLPATSQLTATTVMEVLENELAREELVALHAAMVASLRSELGDSSHKPLDIAVRCDDGTLIGGLSGATFYRWMTIDILWVHPDHRRQRIGAALLSKAESEARERGCSAAHFDTFSTSAVRFYEHLGYSIVSTIFAPGSPAPRHTLFKHLTAV